MRLLSSLFFVLIAISFAAPLALAQEVPPIVVEKDVYLVGVIQNIEEQVIEGLEGQVKRAQIKLEDGEIIEVAYGGILAYGNNSVEIGEKVIVVRNQAGEEISYYLGDRYRLPWITILVIALFVIAILVGRWKGITATLGLVVSALIFGFIIIPQIAQGNDPILVMLLGAIAIATVTTYLAHGFKSSSTIILTSILSVLSLSTLAVIFATKVLGLAGIGSEEAVSLQFGPLASINLEHLLIAGIIIGALGILDDVAATQIAVVEEVAKADTTLSRKELFKRSMHVGREHVIALINTLFLAYAATALPLLLVGSVNLQLPIWALINSEAVSEEILRIVIGSSSLILAVPISTGLAAWWFSRRKDIHTKA